MQLLTNDSLQSKSLSKRENLPQIAKVLVSDPIDQAGIDILSQVATVDVKTNLSPELLVQIIPEYSTLR